MNTEMNKEIIEFLMEGQSIIDNTESYDILLSKFEEAMDILKRIVLTKENFYQYPYYLPNKDENNKHFWDKWTVTYTDETTDLNKDERS